MPAFLIAKFGPYGATLAGLLLAVRVDLGALWVVAGALAIIVAQLIAIPRRMRSFWYQEAQRREDENKVLQEQLREKTSEMAKAQARHQTEVSELQRKAVEELSTFAREQQELRHALKNELAASRGELELEKAKRDYSDVLARVDHVQQTLDQRGEAFLAIAAQVTEHTTILRDIRDSLVRSET